MEKAQGLDPINPLDLFGVRAIAILTGIVWPLLTVLLVGGGIRGAEAEFPDLASLPQWGSYKLILWAIVLVLAGLSVFAGHKLAFVRRPATPKAVAGLLAGIAVGGALGNPIALALADFPWGVELANGILGLLARAIIVGPMIAYLLLSKRVAAAFAPCPEGPGLEPSALAAREAARQGSTRTATNAMRTLSVTVSASPPAPVQSTSENLPPVQRPSIEAEDLQSPRHPVEAGDDDFARALDELESGATVKSAWARAFAETDGDQSKAKARYIAVRAQQLAFERERAEAARRVNLEREEVERKAREARVAAACQRKQQARETGDVSQLTTDDCVDLIKGEDFSVARSSNAIAIRNRRSDGATLVIRSIDELRNYVRDEIVIDTLSLNACMSRLMSEGFDVSRRPGFRGGCLYTVRRDGEKHILNDDVTEFRRFLRSLILTSRAQAART
jgi:hypothetical protein